MIATPLVECSRLQQDAQVPPPWLGPPLIFRRDARLFPLGINADGVLTDTGPRIRVRQPRNPGSPSSDTELPLCSAPYSPTSPYDPLRGGDSDLEAGRVIPAPRRSPPVRGLRCRLESVVTTPAPDSEQPVVNTDELVRSDDRVLPCGQALPQGVPVTYGSHLSNLAVGPSDQGVLPTPAPNSEQPVVNMDELIRSDDSVLPGGQASDQGVFATSGSHSSYFSVDPTDEDIFSYPAADSEQPVVNMDELIRSDDSVLTGGQASDRGVFATSGSQLSNLAVDPTEQPVVDMDELIRADDSVLPCGQASDRSVPAASGLQLSNSAVTAPEQGELPDTDVPSDSDSSVPTVVDPSAVLAHATQLPCYCGACLRHRVAEACSGCGMLYCTSCLSPPSWIEFNNVACALCHARVAPFIMEL